MLSSTRIFFMRSPFLVFGVRSLPDHAPNIPRATAKRKEERGGVLANCDVATALESVEYQLDVVKGGSRIDDAESQNRLTFMLGGRDQSIATFE